MQSRCNPDGLCRALGFRRMTEDQIEYFRRRERQERAAAKSADSLVARRIHQQLAEEYAAQLVQFIWYDPVAVPRSLTS